MDEEYIKCFLCEGFKGLITRTNFGWAHVTCINYIPEVWYEDEYKQTITGRVHPDRRNLLCTICKKKNGFCI